MWRNTRTLNPMPGCPSRRGLECSGNFERAQTLLGLALACLLLTAAGVSGAELRVTLLPQAQVTHELVTIRDVAQVTCSDKALQQRIAVLDLDTLPQPGSETTIVQRRLAIRILLDGITTSQLKITGANQVTVTRVAAVSLTDQAVEDALREALARAWVVRAAEIDLRLTAPLANALPADLAIYPSDSLRPLLTPYTYPGQFRVSMGVYRDEELLTMFSASVSAFLKREVAVAKRTISTGDLIQRDDVQMKVQRLSGRAALDIASHEAIGRYANRAVAAGSFIRNSGIQIEPRETSRPTSTARQAPREEPARTFPARASVTLVARRPGLEVRYNGGKLMQATQVGQVATVKNNAGVVVSGTLLDSGEVLVEF